MDVDLSGIGVQFQSAGEVLQAKRLVGQSKFGNLQVDVGLVQLNIFVGSLFHRTEGLQTQLKSRITPYLEISRPFSCQFSIGRFRDTSKCSEGIDGNAIQFSLELAAGLGEIQPSGTGNVYRSAADIGFRGLDRQETVFQQDVSLQLFRFDT